MKLLYFLALSLALTVMADAQNRWLDLTPEERAARIGAVRDAHHQRIRAERIAQRQREKAAGRVEARASRVRDRAFMAVWTRLTPEVRAMYAARELAERLSRQPAWRIQTRAERIAAATDFITNYQAIKTTRQQATMDAALGAPTGAYPDPPDWGAIAGVMAEEPPRLPELEPAEVPDLFAINRRFNWEKPHGQWMTQLLKDIDAAKAAGDTETYESLTQRYSAWAEKSLRLDADSGR